MLLSITLTVCLVALLVLMHFEALKVIARIAGPSRGARGRMLVIMFGVVVTHVLEIGLYGIGYWIGDKVFDIGDFAGVHAVAFRDYLYFSAETYSSLGIGDIYPLGDLRLLASIEVLIGLLLIGWSASFTYISMIKYWPTTDD